MVAPSSNRFGLALTLVGALALAACAAKPPPAPPPAAPVAPPQVYVPPRPTPPNGAAANMVIPPVGADGVRETVNARLSPAQSLWNLRSGLNVAALNCLDPAYAPLAARYGAMLKTHSRELSAANRAIASEFRKRYGSGYRAEQDAYLTKVYNYFALPPVLDAFCKASLALSEELVRIPRGKLGEFASVALPRLEGVFEDFFRRYEQYRIDLAAWDARYGASARAGSAAAPAQLAADSSAGAHSAQQGAYVAPSKLTGDTMQPIAPQMATSDPTTATAPDESPPVPPSGDAQASSQSGAIRFVSVPVTQGATGEENDRPE